jgi:HK97 family phage prohead protease
MERKIFGQISKGSANDDIYRITASTDDVDRQDEVIRPDAFKGSLDSYLVKNPVILFGHRWGEPPVGKAVAGRVREHSLELDIVFAETQFAKEVRSLVDGGFLNASSVGFIPKTWETDPEGRRVYTDVELLELSIVPIPANAYATIQRSLTADVPTVRRVTEKHSQTASSPAPSGGKGEDQAGSSLLGVADRYIIRNGA